MFSKIPEKIMSANNFGKSLFQCLENPQNFYVTEKQNGLRYENSQE
jgi:hypothetical protein